MSTVAEFVYESKQETWDRYASIRTRPRRILKDHDNHFFPMSRQPLCVHPLIMDLGDEAANFILTQSAYKFMYEIAILETEMVNKAALMIANKKVNIDFPDTLRHDALSVIIDEAYHAYVAVDFINQVSDKTKIMPLNMPKEHPNLNAIAIACQNLPKEYSDLFELIAVCISEHTLTKELISIGREQNVSKFFSEIMADHILDEGRHANIFKKVLTLVWSEFTENEKCLIGTQLPLFIKNYFESQEQIKYDWQILKSLKLTDETIDTIIKDTHINDATLIYQSKNPVIPNIMDLFKKANILEHLPTKEMLIEYSML